MEGLDHEDNLYNLMEISNFFECDQNKQQGYADYSEQDSARHDNLINQNFRMPRTKSQIAITANDNSSNLSTISETINFKERPQGKIDYQNHKYSILICTDFAFPKFGGVETHGY